MLPFHQVVQTDFRAVNQLIVDHLHSDVDLVENIGHYIVDAGGKRLRPLIVLLVAKCLSDSALRDMPQNDAAARAGLYHKLAAIIEFIHTATLLHDDVVDISALRRGRPTANAKWGNAPSVLVGDFLYSRAFQMMVSIGSMDIMAILSDTTNIISEGEVQQLVNAKNPDVTEQDYTVVIHKKTAALFEAACNSAAVLTGANEEVCTQAKKFGYHLGMAFQLVDDALDYSGDSSTLGKNVGDDLAEGKATLPLIHTMTQSNGEETALIRAAIQEGGLDQLEKIVALVKKYDGLNYTRERAAEHAKKAQALLTELPDNCYREAMSTLSTFSVERAY